MTDYPDSPGHRGIDTSVEAAESLTENLGRIQGAVLAAITAAGQNGLTTNEAAESTGIDRGTVQPRTTELRLKGLIADSGQRRRNANGKSAIVWIAKAA